MSQECHIIFRGCWWCGNPYGQGKSCPRGPPVSSGCADSVRTQTSSCCHHGNTVSSLARGHFAWGVGASTCLGSLGDVLGHGGGEVTRGGATGGEPQGAGHPLPGGKHRAPRPWGHVLCLWLGLSSHTDRRQGRVIQKPITCRHAGIPTGTGTLHRVADPPWLMLVPRPGAAPRSGVRTAFESAGATVKRLRVSV